MNKIAFIGAGNMATAIINSMLKNGVEAENISVYDKILDKCLQLDKNLKIEKSISELVKNNDIIFLAVKPQNFNEILPEIRKEIDKSKTLVSIAAGITTRYIKSILGDSCKVVRVMPNTPLMLSCGAVAIAENSEVKADVFDTIKAIFEMSSVVEVVSEDKIDEITALSGSSPAYIYLFTKAIVEHAVSTGIDYDIALNLFTQTLVGSAKMMLESGKDLDELIKMVSSPGGTTLSALDELQKNRFCEGIKLAMTKCAERSKELSELAESSN